MFKINATSGTSTSAVHHRNEEMMVSLTSIPSPFVWPMIKNRLDSRRYHAGLITLCVESLFSFVKNIISGYRKKMGSFTLEMFLLLKCNKNL